MRKHISIFLIAALLLSVVFSFGSVALAADVDLSVETDVTEMTQGGSVEFTATVVNNSGELLTSYAVLNGGHVCYDFDGAPLAAGGVKEVTFDLDVTDSMLGNPINFVVKYTTATLPQTEGGTDSVTIDKKVLSIKIAGSRTIPHTNVDAGDTVTIKFTVENQGEATLDDIVVKAPNLNSGQALNTAFSLSASQSHTFEYKHKVTAAMTIEPKISYTSGGAAQPEYALDPIEITLTSRKVVPVLTVNNKNPEAGEDVTFTLKVKNEGNVPYTDVKVTMNGEEKDFSTSKLDPNKEYEEDYTMSFEVSTEVKFTITLKDHYGEMKSVSSNTIMIELPVDPNSLNAKLKLVMNVDRPQLTSAGTINFSGYISNASEYSLTDISVDEESLGNVFSASSMAPGAKENINWTADINDTTSYQFVLTVKDRDGKAYTINAEPITVTINSTVEPTEFEDAAEVTPMPSGFELTDTKGAFGSLGIWAIIAIVLVVLIIGVGIALIVLWKKGQAPKKTSAAKMSSKRKPSGGYKKSSKKRKSPGSKNYRDRNNF